jgi:cyclopropane fatty-acyl-phospholipid synthase-like methyltransferase
MLENNIIKFYNTYTEKLLLDYLKGNKRTEKAIKYVLSNLDYSDKNILDIGCGIGWSSYEIAKHNINAEIKGIDLSNELLKIGEGIFKKNNITFEQKDITKNYLNENETKYDAIVMIDVYKHIPKDKRKFFHNIINKIITKNGKIILTCPTIYHQNYLKENNPDGLQPIDEDVTFKDVQIFDEEISEKII